MRRFIALVGATSLALAACGGEGSSASGKPKVVAAVYALGFVAQGIAGDRAEVVQLTPAGAEPHDIELSSGQVANIEEADLLVYIDEGFQPAVDDLAVDLGSAAMDVFDSVDVLTAADEHAGETVSSGPTDSEAVDPHVWLDPVRMETIATDVAGRMGEIDSAHARVYKSSAKGLVDRLDELDKEYSEGLQNCAVKEFVTSHEAFGYLAERYGIEQVGIAGFDPEAEPSPQQIANVVQFVEDHDVKTVFFEHLVSPKIAETIASETGASTEVLNPIESPPEQGDYFSEMRSNLQALQEALQCT